MNARERLTRLLIPPLPKQRYMCIRCDEVKDDVPGPWSWCESCEEIVQQIAREHPDVYRKYVERMNAARWGRPYPDKEA